MKRSILLTTCLAAGLAATTAHADDAATLDEAVVTATRLPSLVDQAPGARIVTAEDIEQRQTSFAADVLDTIPGVSVARTGAFGGVTGVRIRGASTDKTLVLVDGVPMNDPSDPNGAFDFAALDLADIDRVEILSGPQGSLWGSEAIGGVVAFTKTIAFELAGHGIRANVVCPGTTDTPMVRALLEKSPDAVNRNLGAVPMGRLAKAEEIADMIVFLTGPASAFVTGTSIPVDGGRTRH